MNDTVSESGVIVPAQRAPAVPMPDPNPMAMIAAAVKQGWEPERLKQLMDLQERWEKSEARKAFDAAIAAAKAEIPVIHKNRTVDFTSAKGRTYYQYEDFAEVARTADPVLSKHGLSYRFRTSSKPGEPVVVTCILAHRSGHYEETTLDAARDDSGNKNSIQAIGSTLTYLQRMTLKAALGLAASADDDARGAGAAGNEEPQPDADGRALLEKCATMASLTKTWNGLPQEKRKTLSGVMNECRARIKEADGQ